ncbi:MAG: ribonuclease HII [Bacteroidota bacterium]
MSLKLQYSHFKLECGTDEAGRGCLAGPVVASAVILPQNFKNKDLNDSKQLSEAKRNKLRIQIEQEAIAWHVAFIEESIIDRINILKASIKAMHHSIDGLSQQPEFIVVDGNKFTPYNNIPFKTIVKGDSKFLNIAAASILAKTYRDEFMEKLHQDFPLYGWNRNKGYPTKGHREAIKKYGPTKFHRKSFKLLPEQYRLQL